MTKTPRADDDILFALMVIAGLAALGVALRELDGDLLLGAVTAALILVAV